MLLPAIANEELKSKVFQTEHSLEWKFEKEGGSKSEQNSFKLKVNLI